MMSLATLYLIDRQPKSLRKLNFTVPLVPYFPAASMLFNIFLMVNLDPITWVRFLVWMALGFTMYFGYGMWHSAEEKSTLLPPKENKHAPATDDLGAEIYSSDFALGDVVTSRH
uniref:Cationic amino acid transporter C-terminal domain-containing protein n=1 Tax=Romanomermis culicivorax TaxID=13658 RepID=A0A915IHW7_ROMCU